MKTITLGKFNLALRFHLFFTVLLLGIAPLRSAEPVDNWAEYPRPEGAGALTSVAFGNGTFVAAGDDGTIVTSANGMDWTRINTTATTGPRRVRFINDRFFILGYVENHIMSTDGTNWSPVGVSFNDITYANGVWHTVLWDQVGKSTNLTDWTYNTVTTPLPVGFRRITAGNGKFIASGGDPGVSFKVSEDGQQWSNSALSSTTFQSDITHQNGSFTAVIYTLFQEPTYFEIDPGLPPQVFYQPRWTHALFLSEDGATWSTAFRLPAGVSAAPNRIATGGAYYVLPAGNSVFYTTNLVGTHIVGATNWTRVDVSVVAPENTSTDVAFGNNTFVAVMHGKIFKSNPVSGFAPLRILNQPQSFSATLGGAAHFTVSAQGSDPVTYQWRHNGTNIASASERTYTVTNVTMETAGEYDVILTNPAGSLTSEKAQLTVHFADVNLYAGVTLRGQIGDQFRLEYREQLDAPEAWQVVTNVTLTTTYSIWIDYDSPQSANRFYRATYVGR